MAPSPSPVAVPAALLAVVAFTVSARGDGSRPHPAAPQSHLVAHSRTAAQQPPGTHRPPFHRLWSFKTDGSLVQSILAGHTVFFGTTESFGALDMKTGRVKWRWTYGLSPGVGTIAWDG